MILDVLGVDFGDDLALFHARAGSGQKDQRKPLPVSGACNTGAPMFMKRRALMEPASRRVFWMTPRAARTVEMAGAATVFGMGAKPPGRSHGTRASRT